MDRKNADLMLLDAAPATTGGVTFHGIDWRRKEARTGCVCPRCQQPHSWRTRIPKSCRHCGIKFYFTAAALTSQGHPLKSE